MNSDSFLSETSRIHNSVGEGESVSASNSSQGVDEQAFCKLCGSSMRWVECWDCNGAGSHEMYEVDPLWYDLDTTETCDTCNGDGGYTVCSAECSEKPSIPNNLDTPRSGPSETRNQGTETTSPSDAELGAPLAPQKKNNEITSL